MFDRIRKWKEREIYTTPDTDKAIDWKYVKDTFREYFIGKKNRTELDKLKAQLFHAKYVGGQICLVFISFGLYIWYPPFTIIMDDFIPNDGILGTNLFMFVGFVAVSFMVSSYLGDISRISKKIKELEKDARRY